MSKQSLMYGIFRMTHHKIINIGIIFQLHLIYKILVFGKHDSEFVITYFL